MKILRMIDPLFDYTIPESETIDSKLIYNWELGPPLDSDGYIAW